ncbi:hypothetical protein ACFL04_01820 [Patescibacteria group bacterium]
MNKTIIIVVVGIIVIGGGIFVFTRGNDTAETSTNTATVTDTTNTTTTTNTNTAAANLNTSISANTNTTSVTNTTNTNTTTTDELSDSEKLDFIQELVQTVTSETTFPVDLDPVTRATNIVATPTAIRYEYTLHDIDESRYNDELLKNNIMPSLCQTAETRIDILDRGVDMEYSYQVENSTQTYFFSVNKEDCI